MVEVVIGNDGPLIPSDDLPRLFDPFFTKGKAGGTGLGLAIAHEAAVECGGRIWCTSSATAGTEFHLVLPASETTALRKVAPVSEPLRIVVIDDEIFYRENVEELFKAHVPHCEVTAVGDVAGATALVEGASVSLDLVVCDIDLGDANVNGLNLIAQFRDRYPRGRTVLCVHSNRNDDATRRAAMAAGADVVLPKPLSREAVLDLVTRCRPASARPRVAVIEDSAFIAESWALHLAGSADVRLFADPESFVAAASGQGGLDLYDWIVTDYYFDGSDTTGVDLAGWIKARRKIPVFLSTEGAGSSTCGPASASRDGRAVIDATIGKEPLSLAQLRQFLGH